MAGPATLFREIHRLRSFIAELDDRLGNMPRAFKARQATLARASAALEAARKGVKSLKVTATTKEKALQAKHALIVKYEEQLNSTASKKEYDAKQLEIAFAKTECTKLEEEVLAAIDEGETLAATLPDLELAAMAAREEVTKFDADMEAKVAVWQSERAAAAAKLAEAEPNVPPALRQVYEKAVQSMGPDALAGVTDGACGGCQAELTRQVRNELASGQFVMCPSCGRIMYLPE